RCIGGYARRCHLWIGGDPCQLACRARPDGSFRDSRASAEAAGYGCASGAGRTKANLMTEPWRRFNLSLIRGCKKSVMSLMGRKTAGKGRQELSPEGRTGPKPDAMSIRWSTQADPHN